MVQSAKSFKAFTLLSFASAAAIGAAAATPAYAQEERRNYDIPAQSLASAIIEFSRQSDVVVTVPSRLTKGKSAPAVRGGYSRAQALQRLIEGSGLRSRPARNGGFVLESARMGNGSWTSGSQTASLLGRDTRVAGEADAGSAPAENDGAEIVVTGTNIRGVYPEAIPLQIYSAEEIRKTGVASTEEFFFKLPQNLSNVSSIATFGTQQGYAGRNQLNLRGLGGGATLVLLNGRRLVSPGGTAPDISLIPLGALERIEVLTDGASAIYGSDAIGGVVNMILKDDAKRPQTNLSYGTVTDGSHRQLRADQTVGFDWSTGHVVASYAFFDQTALDASDRKFASVTAPFSLVPDEQRHSGLLSLKQSLGDRLRLGIDLLASDRDFWSVSRRTIFNQITEASIKQKQGFATAGLTYDLSDDISADLFGAYSIFSERFATDARDISTGDQTLFTDRTIGETLELGGKISGSILNLPAGQVGFAIGGGYGDDKLERGFAPEVLKRDYNYFFGEVAVPLVSPSQLVPGIARLEINGAVRRTKYAGYKARISPRYAALYSPIDGVNFRGSYSEGFRAPDLNRLVPSSAGNAVFALGDFGLPDPFSNDNSTVLLLVTGASNPDIGPELSRTFTLGMDLKDRFVRGLNLSVTYYNIEYTNKLADPDPTGGFGALFDYESYASLFSVNPSASEIEAAIRGSTNYFNGTSADPTNPTALANVVTVLLDNRLRNLSSAHAEGIDIDLNYRFDRGGATWSLGSQATIVTKFSNRIESSSPTIDELDVVLRPLDFRMRGYVGYDSNEGLSGRVSANYYDSYRDPYRATPARVANWFTLDLGVAYRFGHAGPGILSDLELALNIDNLLDRDPPEVGLSNTSNVALNEPIGFDPANANPRGRFITLALRKTW